MTLRETLIEEILHQPDDVLCRLKFYLQSLSHTPTAPKVSGWPPGYFDQVLGTLPDDDPWEEPPELPYEPLEH